MGSPERSYQDTLAAREELFRALDKFQRSISALERDYAENDSILRLINRDKRWLEDVRRTLGALSVLDKIGRMVRFPSPAEIKDAVARDSVREIRGAQDRLEDLIRKMVG